MIHMIPYHQIRKMLIEDEGTRLKPYRCTAGKLTIGIGRNLDDKGISEKEALYLLENDILECAEDLRLIFPFFFDYPDDTKAVLINMRFQHGAAGFREYKRMIAAIHKEDWDGMRREMLDSQWAKNFPGRAGRLVQMI